MTAKTISLKAPGVREEGTASEVITPGHLIEFGGTNDIQKHSTAGGTAAAIFATEQPLDEGQDRDTETNKGDTVSYTQPAPGDEVIARAAKEDISAGDYVESNGDGNVRKFAGDADAISQEVVGVVPPGEGITNSGGTLGKDIVIRIV